MRIHAMRLLIIAWPGLFSMLLVGSPCGAEEKQAPGGTATRFPKAAVASESAIASRVGAEILRRGGNAMDAAVATALALAVVHPTAGNIGGGGFLVAWVPRGEATTFDFREKAPLTATPGMFLDEKGDYDPDRHHWSILAVGVPGSVAGLHLAHERLGKLPWKDLVQPAVDLARRGFTVSRGLSGSLGEVLPSLRKHPASAAQFTREGAPLRDGDLLLQADLARTLERIRDRGPAGFYEGETADLIVKEMERQGGLIRHEDLKRYRAVERKPIRGAYRGHELLSMPPPSSGGVALVEMLNVLEGFDIRSLEPRGPRESHLLIETMRRAYADRARHLGDPEQSRVPVERLTSRAHADELRQSIHPSRSSKSSPERFEWPAEGAQTTHLSVLDHELMAVALTTTLEQDYGSRIVVPGAGFLLNNEMGDFNPRAGLTTDRGLIGTEPNLAASEKRMLSSMTPAIVLKDGKPILVLGSPGGRTIINTVLEVVMNVLDHGMAAQAAVDAPRFHHQWLPDVVQAEPRCFSPDTVAALERMGHRIETRGVQGSVMAIAVVPSPDGKGHLLEAGVDRRRADGGAAGF